jgi:hypothetical protein
MLDVRRTRCGPVGERDSAAVAVSISPNSNDAAANSTNDRGPMTKTPLPVELAEMREDHW